MAPAYCPRPASAAIPPRRKALPAFPFRACWAFPGCRWTPGRPGSGVLQLLLQAGAFPVAPRDQDSACHLRDAWPLDLSGLCHASVSKIRDAGLKETCGEKHLAGKQEAAQYARKTAAEAKPHPPAAGWNQANLAGAWLVGLPLLHRPGCLPRPPSPQPEGHRKSFGRNGGMKLIEPGNRIGYPEAPLLYRRCGRPD